MSGVEFGGGTYEVSQPIEKEFYRDLTFMEDEELVRKYALVKVDSGSDENNKQEKEDDEKAIGDRYCDTIVPEMSITKFV